jgi:hypothetical protein
MADIQVDFSASTVSIVGKDKILVRKVGVPKYGTFDVNFKWDPVSMSMVVDTAIASTVKATGLAITGAIPIKEGSAVTLSAIATFEDGSTAKVVPTWSVSNSEIASVSSTGVLTAKAVTSDSVVNVTASYVDSGNTLQATQPITVTNLPPVPIALTVSGATSIDERTSTKLLAKVKMDDGTEVVVTPIWSGSLAAASIDSGGILTANSVTSDYIVLIRATYSANGATVSGDLLVTIKNKPLPTRTCSGTVTDSFMGTKLIETFTIDPNSNSITLFLESTGANSAFFLYSSLDMVQKGNSINFGVYTYQIGEGTAAFYGDKGWSGVGYIPSGTSKSATLHTFPSYIDLAAPLEFSHGGTPTIVISCP